MHYLVTIPPEAQKDLHWTMVSIEFGSLGDRLRRLAGLFAKETQQFSIHFFGVRDGASAAARRPCCRLGRLVAKQFVGCL